LFGIDHFRDSNGLGCVSPEDRAQALSLVEFARQMQLAASDR
jgi:hypothetical protein